MLAAAYAATRTLWLPIGLHFGWNFAAAGIFGTVVSGSDTPQGLLHGVDVGPRPAVRRRVRPGGEPVRRAGGPGADRRASCGWPTGAVAWCRCGGAPREPRRPLRSDGDRPPAGVRDVAAVRRRRPGPPARGGARCSGRSSGRCTTRGRSSATCRTARWTRSPSRRSRSSASRWPSAAGGRPSAWRWCRSASPSTSSAATTRSPASRCPSRCSARRRTWSATGAPRSSWPPRRTWRWPSPSAGHGSTEGVAGFVTFYLVLAVAWGIGAWLRQTRAAEAEHRRHARRDHPRRRTHPARRRAARRRDPPRDGDGRAGRGGPVPDRRPGPPRPDPHRRHRHRPPGDQRPAAPARRARPRPRAAPAHADRRRAPRPRRADPPGRPAGGVRRGGQRRRTTPAAPRSPPTGSCRRA